eukprot:SAG22_NODE_180_length_16069_cov_5.323231_9_plen_197_part_00
MLDQNHFIYTGQGPPPPWAKTGVVPDPKFKGKTAGYHYREVIMSSKALSIRHASAVFLSKTVPKTVPFRAVLLCRTAGQAAGPPRLPGAERHAAVRAPDPQHRLRVRRARRLLVSKALPFCCAPIGILSKTAPFLVVCLSSLQVLRAVALPRPGAGARQLRGGGRPAAAHRRGLGRGDLLRELRPLICCPFPLHSY